VKLLKQHNLSQHLFSRMYTGNSRKLTSSASGYDISGMMMIKLYKLSIFSLS